MDIGLTQMVMGVGLFERPYKYDGFTNVPDAPPVFVRKIQLKEFVAFFLLLASEEFTLPPGIGV